MKQHEFIWTATNAFKAKPSTISQSRNGVTSIHLNDNIIIYHDYHSADQMTIKVYNKMYAILDDNDFDKILKIYLLNNDWTDLLSKWCAENLKELDLINM